MGRAGLDAIRVAEAAIELADEIGFEAVTISEVARRLAVRVPSLYAHVGGSEDLRVRMAALSLDQLADRAAAAIGGRAGADALVAYADAVRDFAREHPGRYAATRQRVAGDSEAGQAALGAGRRHADLLAAILRGYSLSGPAAVHATRLIGSVIHGFVSLEAAGGFEHSRPASSTTWRRIITDLAADLAAKPSP